MPKATGVTSALKTPGAIGYVSAASLIGAGIHAAAIENSAGGGPNCGVSIVAPPKSATKAYPISTFTYSIVPSNAPQATAVKEFVNYAITKGQSFGAALDFAPLPNVVLSAAQKTLGSL